MDASAHRAFALLKSLAYERVSCSEAEKTAANRLLEEARAAGAQAHLEPFSVPCGRVRRAKLAVTEPYYKEYFATGYERAASTPPEGLDAFLSDKSNRDMGIAGALLARESYLSLESDCA